MEAFVYLLALCVSLSGLAVLDWRYKLAFWFDAKRSALTIAIGVGVFIMWDGSINEGKKTKERVKRCLGRN